MRIAFVGKGGSGKTTMSVLYAQAAREHFESTLIVDADINMHVGELIGISRDDMPPPISLPNNIEAIRRHLLGQNHLISSLAHFVKTTPPNAKSNFIDLGNKSDPVLRQFTVVRKDLRFMTVGTYEDGAIGTSCYHNNLAIFENFLAHVIDYNHLVVADMVAGIDAFANTLFAHFDRIILVVEPTKRGISVFEQYVELSHAAGIGNSLLVLGNKVRSHDDLDFLMSHIPERYFVGALEESAYLRVKEQTGGEVVFSQLEKKGREVIETLVARLSNTETDYGSRWECLTDLHRRYVAQPYISERLGSLSAQIDPSFNLEKFMKEQNENR